MKLSVAPTYFKTAFNSKSIVEGRSFQILTEDYINTEMSPMWNLESHTIINSYDNQTVFTIKKGVQHPGIV